MNLHLAYPVLTPMHLAIKASGGAWKPAVHLQLLNRYLMDLAGRGESHLIVTMPPRHGKALDVNTLVPTRSGWSTIGELKSGDWVFGGNGSPCQVVAVSPVWKNRPAYLVRDDSGETVIADAEHEWVACLCRKWGVYKTYTTKQLARKRRKRALIDRSGPLQTAHLDLSVHPYVLGVWLGDGHSADGRITMSPEDAIWVRERFATVGYRTTDQSEYRSFCVLGLKEKLRDLGVLNDKTIPQVYLRSSVEQRRELLQGLIDTDGYVAPDGQVEFCSTNLALAQGVLELVRSMGCKASMGFGTATLNSKVCGPKYRVSFYLANAASLPRKASRCRNGVKTPGHYVTAEPYGVADTVCIQVDSEDHMFLCGLGMLPTHNSTFISQYFAAWYLGTFPTHNVLVTSYGADFAASWSEKSKAVLAEWGTLFGPNARVLRKARRGYDYSLAGGGNCFTAGVGGQITGKGCHLCIIDDYVKNSEEADSLVYRDKTDSWFRGTVYTRQEPGCVFLIVATRWHEDDLIGRLLQDMANGGQRWSVLNLAAIAESDEQPFPFGTGRKAGEALWPARYPLEKLREIEIVEGPRHWNALYQQRPAPEGCGMFQRAWFDVFPYPPPMLQAVRYWDLAATEKLGSRDPDYTVGTLMGIDADGQYWILDVCRFRGDPGDVERTLRTVATQDAALPPSVVKTPVRIWIEQEPGAGAKMAIRNLIVKTLAGFPAFADPAGTMRGDTGPSRANKVHRADPFSGQAKARNIKLKAGPWVQAWLDELCAFPHGAHDDQCDSASGAFNQLVLRRNAGGASGERRGDVFTGWKAPEITQKPIPMNGFRM